MISVEDELNAELNELINAARRPANTSPLIPTGSNSLINSGKALSGLAISSASNPSDASAKANIPGTKNRNNGSCFK